MMKEIHLLQVINATVQHLAEPFCERHNERKKKLRNDPKYTLILGNTDH